MGCTEPHRAFEPVNIFFVAGSCKIQGIYMREEGCESRVPFQEWRQGATEQGQNPWKCSTGKSRVQGGGGTRFFDIMSEFFFRQVSDTLPPPPSLTFLLL